MLLLTGQDPIGRIKNAYFRVNGPPHAFVLRQIFSAHGHLVLRVSKKPGNRFR